MLTVELLEKLRVVTAEYAIALADAERANLRLQTCRESLNQVQTEFEDWAKKLRDEAPQGSDWDKRRSFKDSRVT